MSESPAGNHRQTLSTAFLLGCRLVVGMVFVYASLDKIAHPDQFARAVYYYRLLPLPLLHPFALILPWVELVCGLALLLGVFRRGAALVCLLMTLTFTVAVDGRGEQYSSEGWSAFLARKMIDGQSQFQFVLGGAFGLDSRVLSAADTRWSLSRLTFPHQMARCIVLEQIYRALRIERGEPYHY